MIGYSGTVQQLRINPEKGSRLAVATRVLNSTNKEKRKSMIEQAQKPTSIKILLEDARFEHERTDVWIHR